MLKEREVRPACLGRGRGGEAGRSSDLDLRARERSERAETLSHCIYIQWVILGRDGLSGLQDGLVSEVGLIACPPLLIDFAR